MSVFRFFWKGGNSSVELDSFKVPNFQVLGHQLAETFVELKTGHNIFSSSKELNHCFSILYVVVIMRLITILMVYKKPFFHLFYNIITKTVNLPSLTFLKICRVHVTF